MRAAVSNVNFILIEGARILWPVCTAALQFAFAAIGDIRASAQRDVSTWLKLTIS